MENSKITRLALSLKFNHDDIDSIMEVIKASGNETVATEILLGVYEAPEVNEIAPDTKYEANKTLVSYDKFKDEVKYTYQSVKELSAWFLKEQPEDERVSESAVSGAESEPETPPPSPLPHYDDFPYYEEEEEELFEDREQPLNEGRRCVVM